jgi:hypothetical protein
MKVRVTVGGSALGARLTALCWGALTLIAPLAVSACSGGSTSTPTVPTFTATVTGGATSPGSGTTTAPGSGSTTSPGSGTTSPGTPGVATTTPAPHTATATATATAHVTVTPTPTPTESKIPSAAPVTGGGGTAGLQDGLLFVIGAAAILAGAGGIVYRRRLTRHR